MNDKLNTVDGDNSPSTTTSNLMDINEPLERVKAERKLQKKQKESMINIIDSFGGVTDGE